MSTQIYVHLQCINILTSSVKLPLYVLYGSISCDTHTFVLCEMPCNEFYFLLCFFIRNSPHLFSADIRMCLSFNLLRWLKRHLYVLSLICNVKVLRYGVWNYGSFASKMHTNGKTQEEDPGIHVSFQWIHRLSRIKHDSWIYKPVGPKWVLEKEWRLQ